MSDPKKPAPKAAPPKPRGAAAPQAASPAPKAAGPAPRAAAPAGRPAAAPAGQQAMAAKAVPAGQAAGDEEEEEEYAPTNRFILFNAVPSWMVSMVVHVVLLLLLALWTFGNEETVRNMLTIGKNDEIEEEIEEFEEPLVEPVEVETVTSEVVAEMVAMEVPVEVTDISPANDLDAAAIHIELSDFGSETAPKNDLLATIGSVTGSGLEGRGAAARGKMVEQYGGSKGSEAAVAAALEWFANHQLPDGSWSFDHRGGACQGRCPDHGNLAQARNGATAMALLPFLGAGQTHLEGKYKNNVKGGLAYLTRSMKVSNGTGDLTEPGGSMYSHGLASIALCEAYAMTHDKGLMGPAQLSINYIVYAQDPVGGGWRYQAKQAGDTSAVGWQLMALKSAHMAYLNVPPNTIRGAVKFLDSVQGGEYGETYGYTTKGAGKATSAVGLLCRMYLGWKHDHPGLSRGVELLGAPSIGGNSGNMYFNYYATQVMRHYEGEPWKKWNEAMRDPLVNSQAKNGHAKGSWYMRGDHGAERGGRHYVTSMATMILEVYYRHLPIYQKGAAEEDFPL